MSAATRIPSLEAEGSVRLVMASLAQHRRQEALLAAMATVAGRLQALPDAATSAQVRRQAVLLRTVSIVEAFMTDGLVRRVEPHAPPPRTSILEDIYTRAEDAAIASWPKLHSHYGSWLGIKITQTVCPSWRRIGAMTNVRNAIAHGMGELTRRMARKDLTQLRHDFATIDVAIAESAVCLSELSLRSSATTAREFIEWVDEQLLDYDARILATTR